jgi:hypothetical protein
MFKLISVLTVLSCSAFAALAAESSLEQSGRSARPAGSFEIAQACGWYAVFECDHSRSLGGPGYVIWTSNYPNFRPGWYCKVMGPFDSQGEASGAARRNGGYAKSAC